MNVSQASRTVFVSYSHKDGDLLESLLSHLNELEFDGVEVFVDKKIDTGSRWNEEIRQALERARVAILLMSSNFTSSHYIRKKELPILLDAARSGRTKIVPVNLKPHTALGDLKEFQAVNPPESTVVDMGEGERDRTWVKVIGEINEVLRKSPRAVPTIATQTDQERQAQPRDVDSIVSRVAERLDGRSLVVFLGPNVYQIASQYPPRSYEISRKLLDNLGLKVPKESFVLPPLDVVSSYYATKNGHYYLEDDVRKLILDRSAEIPPIYQKLANVMRILQNRPPASQPQGQKPPDRLIVTTNFDVLIERALLAAGVSFTRIVQHPSGVCDVNEYLVSRANGTAIRLHREGLIDLNDDAGLRNAIKSSGHRRFDSGKDVPIGELDGPYLYKFHGSQDIDNSCAISTDEYYTLVRTAGIVPEQIGAMLLRGWLLFFGYGVLDPAFRVICNTLLEKSADKVHRELYSVQPPPGEEQNDDYRRMECGIWSEIKDRALRQYQIKVIEEKSDVFMGQLAERLSNT